MATSSGFDDSTEESSLPAENNYRTVDDIPLTNRILPITGILVFLALILVIFDLARKKCFTWKNSFVTSGILFDGGTQEDYLFHDGQTEFKYSPSSNSNKAENCKDGMRKNVTHWQTGKESLDLAILSLSVGDHVVEDLINHRKYLISTNYIEKITEDEQNGVEITIRQNENNFDADQLKANSGIEAVLDENSNLGKLIMKQDQNFEGHEIDISIYNDNGELRFEDNSGLKSSKQMILQLPSTDDSLESMAERNLIGPMLTNHETVNVDGLQEVVVCDQDELILRHSSKWTKKDSQIHPIKLSFRKKSSTPSKRPKMQDEEELHHPRRLRSQNSATF